MSLEDRLAAHREEIRAITELVPNLFKLRSATVKFGSLLLDSDKFSESMKAQINQVLAGFGGGLQFAHAASYEREYLKAAYWLVGIYDCAYNNN